MPIKIMNRPSIFIVSLTLAILLVAEPVIAAAGQAPSQGGIGPSTRPEEARGPSPSPQGQPGGNGSQISGGQAGDGAGSTSGQSSAWHSAILAYRIESKYAYAFNFSRPDVLAGKSVPISGRSWFNASGEHINSGMSKNIARQRILSLLAEMEALKTMAGESGLSADERAAIVSGIDDNARWLNDTDSEIQAAGDLKSLGQAISAAEPMIAAIRSEVKANAGLLACRNMDERLALAINASEMAGGRIKILSLTVEDKAWYTRQLDDYDQHVYVACLHQDAARTSFLAYSETRNEMDYIEGLRQAELAQKELDDAFDTLRDIFYSL